MFSLAASCIIALLLLLAAHSSVGFAAQDNDSLITIHLADFADPEKRLRLRVRRDLLSPESQRGIKDGELRTDWLYLRVQYPISTAAGSGAAIDRSSTLVHLFIRPVRLEHQKDIGLWYKKQAERSRSPSANIGGPQMQLADGITRYSSANSKTEYFAYETSLGKLVFVTCLMRICVARRSLDDVVRVEYRFDRRLVEHLKQVGVYVDGMVQQAMND